MSPTPMYNITQWVIIWICLPSPQEVLCTRMSFFSFKSLKHLHLKFYVQSELLQLILWVLRLDWFAQLLMRWPIWSLAVFATIAGAFTACTATQSCQTSFFQTTCTHNFRIITFIHWNTRMLNCSLCRQFI